MKSRNLGLDVLRFLAIVLVLGRHLSLPYTPTGGPWVDFLSVWHKGGWIGVDLFFVLSGYLVSGLLFQEHLRTGSVSPVRFLVRRGFKIYPAFWVLLGISLSAKVLFGSTPLTTSSVIGELLFVQNYLGGIWPHTWSLAVEEHFYLALAMVIPWLLKRRGPDGMQAVPWIFLTSAVGCLFGRYCAAYDADGFSFPEVIYPTHLRIDSLMFGVLLSYWKNYGKSLARAARVPAILLVVTGGACFVPAFCFTLEGTPWLAVYGPVMFYVGAGLMVIAAVRLKDSKVAILAGMGAVGRASYSIYLWHIPVSLFAARLTAPLQNHSIASYLLLYLGGSAAVGIALARMVERPFLSLRDRMFPSVGTNPVESLRANELLAQPPHSTATALE